MHRAPVVLALALLSVPLHAWAQQHRHRSPDTPIGPEFQVNSYVPGDQRGAFVAGTLGYANRVTVWTSDGQDGSGLGVFGRALSGGEFRVNSYTTGDQSQPSVAVHNSGTFVVVWTSGQDGSEPGVFAQRYAAAGSPLGPEFRVNTFTTGRQYQPRVAVAGSGDFIVAWSSEGEDGSAHGVFAQRYAASGGPLGAEFRVNTYTTGYQYHPAVSADAGAGSSFVVVWQDGTAPGGGGGLPGRGVFGQRYASAGSPLGPEFQVETFTTGFQGAPAVVVQPGGAFVVAWHSDGQDGSGLGIFGQRYSSGGTPFGSEFRVNAYTTGSQASPTIATDGVGCFFIAWNGPDGSGTGIFGQSYVFGDPGFEPEYQVNTYSTGNQVRPIASSDPSFPGTFVVAWDSQGQDGSGYGVFARIDNHFIPVELMTIEVE